MADNALWLNGREASSIGLRVLAFDGLFGGQEFAYPEAVIPGRTGVMSGAPYAVGPKEFTCYCRVEAASAAALEERITAVEYACGMGALVEIRTLHNLNRVMYGRVRRYRFLPPRPQGIQPLADGEITFTIPAGVGYERIPRTYMAPPGTRVAPMLGRMASAPVLQILAIGTNAVNPVITYRHANGTVLRQMTLTVTLTADEDYLGIDCDTYQISRSDNGVVSDGANLLTPGPLILLDPHDGDPESGAWPTVEVNSGTLLVRVRRVDPL